jgi:hypothetical protein
MILAVGNLIYTVTRALLRFMLTTLYKVSLTLEKETDEGKE